LPRVLPAPALEQHLLALGSHRRLLLVDIAERGTYGRAVLAVFGNDKPHIVELLELGVHLTALRQPRQVADEHKIACAALERAQYGCRAYGLEHHADEPQSDVLAAGIALRVGKEACRGIHGQARQRPGRDVAYAQIDIGDVAQQGHVRNLLDIVGVEQQAAQAVERAAAYANASQVGDFTVVI